MIKAITKAFIGVGLLSLVLSSGCQEGVQKLTAAQKALVEKTKQFEGARNADDSSAKTLSLEARWVHVASLHVQDRPVYDTKLEVAVAGYTYPNGRIGCELLTEHKRFRKEKPWNPLPIALYTVERVNTKGQEELNPLFQETLDFSVHSISYKSLKFETKFTRGKQFTSEWDIYPLLAAASGGGIECTAVATLDKGPQVNCGENFVKCQLQQIVAVADWFRYAQGELAKLPMRKRDDLTSLDIYTRPIGEDLYPLDTEFKARNAEGFK